ncbi:hypothetical protein IAD21_00349 [Abditibacteriota bacterium]|nr:hypothetical protein IAD21_00349 [Abditibacteriota bacterium]
MTSSRIYQLHAALLFVAFSGIACTSSTAQTPPGTQPATQIVAQPAVQTPARPALLRFDFNGANPWPKGAMDVMPSTPIDVATTMEAKNVGTVDVADSTDASGALLLKSEVGKVGLPWIATYSSGVLPVQNSETNLGKLTLSLDLSASMARPVVVRVESFNAKKNRTGGLETTIYPAAPDFFQRYALDLNTMTPNGAGKFNPTDPNLQLSFELSSPAWPDGASHEIRIDNVQYATPTFYVSANGSDQNDGKTEKTAFASPQKAIDMAVPGDIIDVMNGTYKPNGDQSGVALFGRGGAPAAWIVLKNYPGQSPVFSAVNTWNAVRIGRANNGKGDGINDLPTLCYLEVRGLHVRGNGDTVKQTNPDTIGKSSAMSNSNGISADGKFEKVKPHHIRFADNVVEFCAGGGLSAIQSDWVTVENNTVRNNCWTMIYGGSGISFLDSSNFDGASNVYKSLIRNNIASGNETFVPWAQVKKISDGNGIIIDTNNNPAKGHVYLGRTLVCNNLSFNNGGSGIHSFKSHQVDIINNTAYMNGASPELKWGQIFLQRTDDARVMNNILWARDGQPVNSVGLNPNDKENTHVVRANNLYFGGVGPIMGDGDKVADPMFVNPSIDPKVADFHLKPGSPAVGSGRVEAFTPYTDLDGKARGAKPTAGAYQQ